MMELQGFDAFIYALGWFALWYFIIKILLAMFFPKDW